MPQARKGIISSTNYGLKDLKGYEAYKDLFSQEEYKAIVKTGLEDFLTSNQVPSFVATIDKLLEKYL